MYWPSFNGAMLGEKPFQQNRAFINTYISLAAACVATFVVSSLVDKKGKIDMVMYILQILPVYMRVCLCVRNRLPNHAYNCDATYTGYLFGLK